MYELIQAGPGSWYIDCPVKVGIVALGEGNVCLIDSGADKDAGRKVKKILDQQGWRLSCILNTHSNADHIGGNQYLQKNTGCPVFATDLEAAFVRHPLMESSLLYGGYPMKALRHKFLLAQESAALPLDHPDFPQQIQAIPLPGHFLDMVGYRAPDGTLFLADCLMSEEALGKYPISFLYDVAQYLHTLDQVAQMEAPLFVPAHAPATRDIAPLADRNKEAVLQVAAQILSLLKQPHTTEGLLQALFDLYRLTMTPEQYALVGSTLRSYLSWLWDSGQVEGYFDNNMLLFKA